MRLYLLFVGLFLLAGCDGRRDRVVVDVAQKGDRIPASLYGIFFEEITHSGDGGLYAEMVMNRGFEDGNLPSGTSLRDGFAVAEHKPCYSNDSINKFKIPWSADKAMNGWEVRNTGGTAVRSAIVTERPLNRATPHSLRLDLASSDSEVQVLNTGYWGIAMQEGATYRLEFYLRANAACGEKIEIAMVNPQGEKMGSQLLEVSRDNRWNHYELALRVPETRNDYRLALCFPNQGQAWVDYVSLFPEKTFKGRKNGLREDVAQKLAELKPDFIRWPGGCIVEGLTLDNRVKWKETIGDPVTRPGEYNLWGYRSTYGFGYYEFLQFCEDINAHGMFVCTAGMSCLFRNGDYADSVKVEKLIQEALDAVEFAIGDTTTHWGKERARMGHPAPFPLKYVEIGNENIGRRYAAHYNRFHRAIKARYPQIELVCALMFSKDIQALDTVEIIDPHYYETAEWFYNNAYVYDRLPDTLPFKVYVGEYAAVGSSSLYSSLAEAAYLTGVERNAEKVQLVSYAPLLEHAHHGENHLLVLKNDSVYGRTNYYVLKMFSENRPDVNLKTEICADSLVVPYRPSGFVGLSTEGTSVAFKDFRVETEGQTVYRTQWADYDMAWHTVRGNWKAEDGVLTQQQTDGNALIWLKNRKFGDCTIHVKARKLKGREGFKVAFGGEDENHYFMADMGSHTNESVLFREIGDKGSVSLFDYRNQEPVLVDHWYDVRIEIRGNNWKCFMDDRLMYEYNYNKIQKHYAIAGYDEQANEIVVKLVNGENCPWTTQVCLENAGKLTGQGEMICLSGVTPQAENSFAAPEAIVPVRTPLQHLSSTLKLTCKPNSFTIIRIGCE